MAADQGGGTARRNDGRFPWILAQGIRGSRQRQTVSCSSGKGQVQEEKPAAVIVEQHEENKRFSDGGNRPIYDVVAVHRPPGRGEPLVTT